MGTSTAEDESASLSLLTTYRRCFLFIVFLLCLLEGWEHANLGSSNYADVVKLADTRDSGSRAPQKHAGSSPVIRTNYPRVFFMKTSSLKGK